MSRNALSFRTIAGTLLPGVFLLTSTTSQAAIVVDQSTINISTSTVQSGAVGRTAGIPGSSDRMIDAAQTLTVGIDGQLMQVDLWLGRQADTTGVLNFAIFAGIPQSQQTTAALYETKISANQIASNSVFSLSRVEVNISAASLNFHKNDIFSIVLSAPDTPISNIEKYYTPFTWALDSDLIYAGGARYIRELQIGSNWNASNADQAVQTWVNTSPVPEPATNLLSFAGILVLVTIAKQKNRNSPRSEPRL